jgi:hypothetical protein
VQHSALGAAGIGGRILQRDDTIAVLRRKARIEHLGDDFERHRADGNRHRHRETADDRQAAMLDEHADAEPRVERQRVQPGQSPRITAFFLVLLDAAERDQRLPPGFPGIEAALAHEPFGVHLDVEAHLRVHGRVEAIPTPQPAPLPHPRSDLLSRRPQRHRDRFREPVPARRFLAKPRAAGRGEVIELRLAVVLRRSPLGVDQPLLFEAVQRGIQCALLNLERTTRNLLNPQQHAVAV